MLMRKACAGFVAINLIFWNVSLPAAQDLRDPRFMERAGVGFAHIFNLDYDSADSVFRELAREYPRHPAPPLYLASIPWLRELLRRQDLSLDRFLSPGYFAKKTGHTMSSQDREAFFKMLQEGQALANTIVQRNPKDEDGRYFLAMSYGLEAAFAITIDHNLREAFSYGNRAFDYDAKLVKENPNYYDACLTVGLYEYIVSSLPWYLRWLAYVIGFHGSKEAGLNHVKIAAEKGPYVKNEANLVEMVLDMREHRYVEALDLARSFNKSYPRNFLYALNIAQILETMGQYDQAVSSYVQVLRRAEAGEPNYGMLPLETFRYSLGKELMKLGRLDIAQEQFRKSIENPQTPDKEQALSHLLLGEIFDQAGKRGEAIKEYQTVLTLGDFENSHDQARDLLKKPH